jgi:hypothetical protein
MNGVHFSSKPLGRNEKSVLLPAGLIGDPRGFPPEALTGIENAPRIVKMRIDFTGARHINSSRKLAPNNF